MKRYYQYIMAGFFCLAFLTVACETQEPKFYDGNQNGVYFDYNESADFQRDINFADYVIGNPQEVTLNLKMKLLGYLVDGNRKAVLKTKPVEGYQEASVILPEVVFTSEETEKEIEITVNRPTERDTEYAVCIYLDAEDAASQLGHGIEGKEEFVLYVTEEYAPAWSENDWFVQYIGPWSVEKHIFFINLTQDNDYASSSKLNDYYTLLNYNLQAVNALRQQRQENPDEEITIDIPFVGDNYYDQPYYWGELHNKYIGNYSPSLFASLASAAGANTANETEVLNGDEEVMKGLNRTAVSYMMNQYDMYFYSWGLTCDSYQYQCWIPMYPEIDYSVSQPACWIGYVSGGKEMIEQYYGEYSDEKYKFMIKTWLEKQGTNDFVLVQIFPLKAAWDPTYSYQEAVWDDSIGGENQIQQCYQAFKEAYDAAPAGTYSFTFPAVTIE